jgi:selenocysteine lyase/cysteine desulfurase
VSLNLAETAADLIAAPGHKGVLGPLGTGILAIASSVERELEPLRQGGTGTNSESDEQPVTLPDRYEAGNHNVPGIVGLGAGVGFLLERGLPAVRQHEMELTAHLLNGLQSVRGVTLYGPRDVSRRVGVHSFTIAGYDPQEVAAMLDASHSIEVRAGLHCAPLMHAALGTAETGGTVRLSVGPFTSASDIDAALAAVAEIAVS